MDLESAAQCEMAIHDYARRVASAQLWRGRAAKVRLKRNVVYQIPGKLEAIAENHHAATKDAQLDDFITEAISRCDSQFSEIGLRDLNFRGEAVVRGADLTVQPRLPTRIHRDYRLEARFEPGRTVSRFGCLLGDGFGCLLGNGD
jgi:hypothetical protein